MKESKREGLKYLIFIGIPVIIVLIILGTYYYTTNPMIVMTKTINTIGDKLEKVIDNSYEINLEEKPLQMNGNLRFQTNIEELKELQDYNYDFQLDLDNQQKYCNLGLGLNKNTDKILNANLYQKENQIFIESTDLYSTPINISSLLSTDLEITKHDNFNKNDFKIMIQKWKKYFLETLDSTYINREKKDITINNQTAKTTKITYLLNEANQKRTYDILYEKVINDEELLKAMANITYQEKEEVKETLKEQKENFSYRADNTIEIYTEGLNQHVIKVELKEDDESILIYENYKNKMDLNFMNELKLENIILTEQKLEFDYEFIQEDITGKFKLETEDKENTEQYKMDISSKIQNETIEINLDLKITKTPNIVIPDISSNAQDYENLTSEDMLTILNNLEGKLKDTYFYRLIEKNIM